MSLAVSIPGCIILIIIIIAAICSALPTRSTLVCTKTETVDNYTVETKIAGYFSKEDVLKSTIMTITYRSDEEIPDSEMDAIKAEYENSIYFDSFEVERIDDYEISIEIVLSSSLTTTFGTKFSEVREYIINNYEMTCNDK